MGKINPKSMMSSLHFNRKIRPSINLSSIFKPTLTFDRRDEFQSDKFHEFVQSRRYAYILALSPLKLQLGIHHIKNTAKQLQQTLSNSSRLFKNWH